MEPMTQMLRLRSWGFLAALLGMLAPFLISGAVSAAQDGASKTASLIVNAAPPFSGGAEAGRNIQLSSLRGVPVLLLIAPSPRDRAFRNQISKLKGSYEKLAAQGILCFAAFTSEGGRIPSNIPFILVNNPAATAAAYNVQSGFAAVLIGRDGNLDCFSATPLPGQRILDLIMNNATMQTLMRRAKSSQP